MESKNRGIFIQHCSWPRTSSTVSEVCVEDNNVHGGYKDGTSISIAGPGINIQLSLLDDKVRV